MVMRVLLVLIGLVRLATSNIELLPRLSARDITSLEAEPCSSVLLKSYVDNHQNQRFRRLVGSNCELIERGTMPPYWDCMGCIVEEAQGCIDDLRFNASGLVPPKCKMSSLLQTATMQARECCPHFNYTRGRRAGDKFDPLNISTFPEENERWMLDMTTWSSAYPEVIRCLGRVGCQDHLLAREIVAECENVCKSIKDPRFREGPRSTSVCFADFSAAPRSTISPMINSITISLGVTFLVTFVFG